MQHISIPDSVTSIGERAFWLCGSLTDITIPDSINAIGDGAFSECESLTGVYFEGNMIPPPSSIFLHSTQATVYYLPDTIGWGNSYGGQPAMLWNPLIQNPGIRNDSFSFDITGTNNMLVVIQVSTNLGSDIWFSVQTCSVDGIINYSDRHWTNHSTRFYGLSMP
jgi:hypothetical protein